MRAIRRGNEKYTVTRPCDRVTYDVVSRHIRCSNLCRTKDLSVDLGKYLERYAHIHQIYECKIFWNEIKNFTRIDIT